MADDQCGSRPGGGNALGGADSGPRARQRPMGPGWPGLGLRAGPGPGHGPGSQAMAPVPITRATRMARATGAITPRPTSGRRGPRGGGRDSQPNPQPTYRRQPNNFKRNAVTANAAPSFLPPGRGRLFCLIPARGRTSSPGAMAPRHKKGWPRSQSAPSLDVCPG